MELGLAGRRAVVTGGSKGLGRAIALELAGEGVSLAICARNADEVAAAAEELRATGARVAVHAQAADVTDPEQVRAFIAASAESVSQLHVQVGLHRQGIGSALRCWNPGGPPMRSAFIARNLRSILTMAGRLSD
jgi:3-oxoacyl-[acyl-carrier protein] reductase